MWTLVTGSISSETKLSTPSTHPTITPSTPSHITRMRKTNNWLNDLTNHPGGEKKPKKNRALPTVYDKFQPRWLSGDHRGEERQQDERIHLSWSSAVCCVWKNKMINPSTKSTSSFLRSVPAKKTRSLPDPLRARSVPPTAGPGPIASVCSAGGSVWRSRGIRLHLGNKRHKREREWEGVEECRRSAREQEWEVGFAQKKL